MGPDGPFLCQQTNQIKTIMKLYVVYFRTMQDSPEVEIRCVTADESKATAAFEKAKEEEREWMADEDEDSGNWAEARLEVFGKTEQRNPGDIVFLAVETVWHECVETSIAPYLYEINANAHVDFRREDLMKDYPGLTPFDEDESPEKSMHLEDPSVMVDVYFDVIACKLV